MRPTYLRRLLTLVAIGALGLFGACRGAGADAPGCERAVLAGIAEQDAEIARGSAKAVATRLESQASRNRQDFVLHYLLARAYGKDSRRADAISAYGEAIALDPTCCFPWRDRGVLRWLEKDVRGAEQDLRQAIALNPRMLEALQPLGALLIEQKRYSEGIVILTQALNVDPGLDSARLQIADAFLALGAADNAIQTLAPLLAKAPKDPMLRIAHARYLAAAHREDEAQRILKQLAIENPNNPGPLNAWLAIAVRTKKIDPEEGVWVLEQLRRLARTADERAKLTTEIESLRKQMAAAAAPPEPRTGPPTAEELARALRSPDKRSREAVVFYILTGVPKSFTITEDLALALIERLKVAQGADVPAKGEDVPRIRAFVVEILGRFGTPEFASIVRLSLRDPDGNVRRKAADALGQLKSLLGVAAMWRYAKGSDVDLALSARQAVYLLAKVAEPAAEPTADAQAAAFEAWWTSPDARDVKLKSIAEVLTSADRSVDELLFPLAYLDADEVVAMAAYKGLRSLAQIAATTASDLKKSGKAVPAGITWMAALPDLSESQSPPLTTDPKAPVAPVVVEAKPFKNQALGEWWMRRPS